MIEKRASRTGDGSRQHSKSLNPPDGFEPIVEPVEKDNSNLIWGWDDVDMKSSDKKYVTIINRI